MQLSAKDLRIGNLVHGLYYDDEDDEKKELCEVIGLDSVGFSEDSIWVDGKENTGTEMYHGFEGILLTEDWLLKFGYELESYKLNGVLQFYAIEGKRLIIVLEDGLLMAYDCIWWNYLGHTPLIKDGDFWELIELKYVHKIQNLYADLCEEELKIKEYA